MVPSLNVAVACSTIVPDAAALTGPAAPVASAAHIIDNVKIRIITLPSKQKRYASQVGTANAAIMPANASTLRAPLPLREREGPAAQRWEGEGTPPPQSNAPCAPV